MGAVGLGTAGLGAAGLGAAAAGMGSNGMNHQSPAGMGSNGMAETIGSNHYEQQKHEMMMRLGTDPNAMRMVCHVCRLIDSLHSQSSVSSSIIEFLNFRCHNP